MVIGFGQVMLGNWPSVTVMINCKVVRLVLPAWSQTEYVTRVSPTGKVAPGPVLLPPDFTAEQIEDARQHTLVKRLGAPEDVSRMIALLIEHDYLTGHVYFIDGGELFTH